MAFGKDTLSKEEFEKRRAFFKNKTEQQAEKAPPSRDPLGKEKFETRNKIRDDKSWVKQQQPQSREEDRLVGPTRKTSEDRNAWADKRRSDRSEMRK